MFFCWFFVDPDTKFLLVDHIKLDRANTTSMHTQYTNAHTTIANTTSENNNAHTCCLQIPYIRCCCSQFYNAHSLYPHPSSSSLVNAVKIVHKLYLKNARLQWSSNSDGLNKTIMHNIVYQIWSLDSGESGQLRCEWNQRMYLPVCERVSSIWIGGREMARNDVENPAT
jgi:hypothetical protein